MKRNENKAHDAKKKKKKKETILQNFDKYNASEILNMLKI